MRITLIEPARLGPDGRPVRTRKTLFPTMTLPYVAALTPRGHEVRIVQDAQEEIDFEDRPDLVGLTSITLHVRRAYDIAAEFRRRGVYVAMGGVHATLAPDEARRHADTVIAGEAEETWPRFLRDFEAGAPGPFYAAGRPPALEGLPVPRWDLLPRWDTGQFLGLFKALAWLTAPRRLRFRPAVTVQTSRGCAVNCDYCTVTKFFGARTRYRPVGEIVDEVRALGSRLIFFTDDNLFADPDRAMELFAALEPLRVRWLGFAPVGVGARPDLLEAARASGCVAAMLGIESLCADSLGSVGKVINRPETYAENLRALRRAGIAAVALFMLGFDHEPPDAADRTRRFVLENRIPFGFFSTVTPYPGTRLHDRLAREGRLREEAWWMRRDRPVNRMDFIRPGAGPDEFFGDFYRSYRGVFSLRSSFLRAFRPPARHAVPIFFLNLFFGRNVRRTNSVFD